MIGKALGHYQVVAKLGEGGMGEVYRARDTKLGRDVALKILPDAFAHDPDRLARFEREAKTLASLNHPNIAQIYGLEESGPHPALVMEFVDGLTLHDMIQAKGQRLKAQDSGHAHVGPWPWALGLADALPIARQIALALEAAHELGIVHRDLKPANIKVRPDGSVKVLDFGLAKALDPVQSGASDPANLPTITSPAMTQGGVILGTAAYMSPEQARGKPVDRRADIWAFGCVFYEMLSGQRAFEGEDVSTTIAAVLKETPDQTALPADLPSSLRRLLRRCLEKEPHKRLSAIGDARLELEEPEESVRTVPLPVAARRSPLMLIGAAVVGALIAGGAMWAWLRPAPAASDIPHRMSMLPPEGAELFPDAAAAAVSPNGRWVAFATERTGAGAGKLWVREIGALTPRLLSGTDNAILPFWSPDSERIGYFVEGKLMTIPVAGGPPTEVCDATDGRGGTWNAAGVIVFAPSPSDPLMRVSASGGDPVPVTALDQSKKETGHRYPFFLPDGDHFLFAALPGQDRKYETSVGSLSEGVTSRQPIGSFESAAVYAPPGYLLFMRRGALAAQTFDARLRRLAGEPIALLDGPGGAGDRWTGGPAVSVASDGALVYLTPDPNPNTRLAWFDRTGKELTAVAVTPAQYVEIALSPDDKRVAVVRRTAPGQSTIWLIDLVRGGPPRPITQARGQHGQLQWSHDGKRLFFSSDRTGREQIYVKEVDGSAPEEIVYSSAAQFKGATAVSPDGKWLIVQELTDRSQIKLVALPDGKDSKPILSSARDSMFAEISPDGRWLAYMSNKNGPMELFVLPFPGLDREWPITTGMQTAKWRSDSRQLLMIDAEGVVIVDLQVGPDVRLISRRPFFPQLPSQVRHGDGTADFDRALLVIGRGPRSLTHVTGWTAGLGGK